MVEYCSPVWSPVAVTLINQLKSVQWRFTKRLYRDFVTVRRALCFTGTRPSRASSITCRLNSDLIWIYITNCIFVFSIFYLAAFKRHYALRLAIPPEFFYCFYMCLFYVCALGCWNKICMYVCKIRQIDAAHLCIRWRILIWVPIYTPVKVGSSMPHSS